MSNQPLPLRPPTVPGALGPSTSQPFCALVAECSAASGLTIQLDSGELLACEVLQTSALPVSYAVGDRVLVLPLGAAAMPVVIGRVCSAEDAAQPPDVLQVAAQQSLSLRCGDASVDLRADGKVMIRGDDVLVRAKGTQRIRAGTVSIN